MSSGSIQVNPAELTRIAQAARKDVAAIGNALRAGSTAVAYTANGPWASQSADITRQRMLQFTGTHGVLTERLTAWANMLEMTAAQYTEVEEAINADINKIREIRLPSFDASGGSISAQLGGETAGGTSRT